MGENMAMEQEGEVTQVWNLPAKLVAGLINKS